MWGPPAGASQRSALGEGRKTEVKEPSLPDYPQPTLQEAVAASFRNQNPDPRGDQSGCGSLKPDAFTKSNMYLDPSGLFGNSSKGKEFYPQNERKPNF